MSAFLMNLSMFAYNNVRVSTSKFLTIHSNLIYVCESLNNKKIFGLVERKGYIM